MKTFLICFVVAVLTYLLAWASFSLLGWAGPILLIVLYFLLGVIIAKDINKEIDFREP